MTQQDKPDAPNGGFDRAVPQHTPITSYKARYAAGKALRDACPRESHAIWTPASNRPEPVQMMQRSEKGRIAALLPLRHGRMVRSPFAFYRAGAAPMAFDLAKSPSSGIRVQCCGDAHLSNFGGFATPERRVIFAINDLDETLPAPWEWDVKRLAASFVIGCRDNGLSESVAKDVARTCVRTYRESMGEFSRMKTLELWYESMSADDLVANIKDPRSKDRALRRLQKERGRSAAQDIFPKLAEQKGAVPVIRDELPTIFHAEGHTPGQVEQVVRDTILGYRATLPLAYRGLLDRYELRDAAMKVVGVGSVGTSCWVLLLLAGDQDPLFLQVKEARPSVLAPYAGASEFENQGERVVHGYRLMQSASDIFLGWSRGPRRDFFIRQLRDIKISVRVETFGREEMDLYATWCGRALALSHARTGDAATLSGYMGNSDAFDRAVSAFSFLYADQNESDHAALDRAVRDGKVKAIFEEAR
jgi:uncharacterized protein (DUF2252 family)